MRYLKCTQQDQWKKCPNKSRGEVYGVHLRKTIRLVRIPRQLKKRHELLLSENGIITDPKQKRKDASSSKEARISTSNGDCQIEKRWAELTTEIRFFLLPTANLS